jgi:uncharacterized protein YcbX
MRLGTVSQLWRYPVKSMIGERLDTAEIGARGVAGDRGWAVRDIDRGGVTNAKRLPALRACRARYLSDPVDGLSPPHVELTLPDGTCVSSEDPDASRRLSAALGRAVALESLGPEGAQSAPRISSAADTAGYRRRLMGLARGEPEPDMSAFPSQRLIELRRDNFFDALPVHVLTTATLAALARLVPEPDWDARRFRMNVLIDTADADGFPELGWLGQRVKIGSAAVEITDACPRCVMVTQAVDELPIDRQLMRTLVRETKHVAGVYGIVITAGIVELGAVVEST